MAFSLRHPGSPARPPSAGPGRARPLVALALAASLAAASPGCDLGDEDADDADDGVEQAAPGEDLGEAALPACDFGPGVKGIDVSYYQGSVDWNAVAGDGWKWAIARVSHSTEFMDPEFQTNWNAIKAAGMVRGVYQYFEPNEAPGPQAQVVIDAVGMLGDGDLPAVIDVEEGGATSSASYIANIRTWMELVEAGTGKKPIIYTGSYFWDDNIGTAEFNDHILWLAHYTTNCPRVPESWDGDWGFWQYTSTGGIPGIPGDVDKNWFKGTEADLRALAGGSTGSYAASLVEVDVPVTVLAGEAFDVTVRYTNSGGTAWDGSTSLGTSEPRDRASAFHDASWPSDHRAAVVTGAVAPGAEHAFVFTMRAPDAPGAYVEHFGLVQEGVTWFADQGGPADDVVRIAIQVLDPGGSGGVGGGASGEGGEGGDDGDSSIAAGVLTGGGGAGDGGGSSDGEAAVAEDTCGVAQAGGPARRATIPGALAALALLWVGRRAGRPRSDARRQV